MEIQVLAWDRHNNVVDFNRLIDSNIPPFANWISNDNTYITKRQQICTVLFFNYVLWFFNDTLSFLTKVYTVV
jgi:hypothetical protein